MACQACITAYNVASLLLLMAGVALTLRIAWIWRLAYTHLNPGLKLCVWMTVADCGMLALLVPDAFYRLVHAPCHPGEPLCPCR